MMDGVHPAALVDAGGQLGAGVQIGPYAIIGEGCVVGDGCVIAARAIFERYVLVGRNVKGGSGSILGGDPQEFKFKGEYTTVERGDDSTSSEYFTIKQRTMHPPETQPR